MDKAYPSEDPNRALLVFLGLALAASLLPVFNGYVLSFFALIWSVRNGLNFKHFVHTQRALFFLICAISLIWLSSTISAFTSEFTRGLLKEWNKSGHLTTKLWLIPTVWLMFFGRLQTCFDLRGLEAKLLKPILAFFALYFLYCLLQKVLGINWVKGLGVYLPDNRINPDGSYRLNGMISHPLSFAYNLVLLFGFSLLMTCQSRWKRQWGVITFMIFAMLALSGSRWPLVCCVVGAGYAFFRIVGLNKKLYWLVPIMAALVIGLYIEGSFLDRIMEALHHVRHGDDLSEYFKRIGFWKSHWGLFTEHPFSGVGLSGKKQAVYQYYSEIGFSSKIHSAHNIFLEFMSNLGVFGVASILGVLGFIFLQRNRNALEFLPAMTCVHAKVLVEYLVLVSVMAGLMQNNLRDSEYCYALWILLTLGRHLIENASIKASKA